MKPQHIVHANVTTTITGYAPGSLSQMLRFSWSMFFGMSMCRWARDSAANVRLAAVGALLVRRHRK